eukprot:2258728-Amphidinium_carterae.1
MRIHNNSRRCLAICLLQANFSGDTSGFTKLLHSLRLVSWVFVRRHHMLKSASICMGCLSAQEDYDASSND